MLQVEKEVQRRKELDRLSRERKAIISQNYKPKHPQLYILQVKDVLRCVCTSVYAQRKGEEEEGTYANYEAK